MNNTIELELDSDEIAILREGGAVCKETDNSDLPVLFIYKWDIAKELQNGLDEGENKVDVWYELDEDINRKRKRFQREGLLEGIPE